MSGIINKVKEAIIPSAQTSTDTTAHDSSYGPGGASTQRSNFASGGDATTHDTHGPRQSQIGGAAEHNQKGGSLLAKLTDPRGEFDNDKQVGSGTRHTGVSGGSTNAGPHSSNVANKLDPKVDSDRDGDAMGRGTAGGFGSNTTHQGSTNAGPHSSNVANKLDPRVDSDRDGSNRHTGGTMAGMGTMGTSTHHGSTNTGPHNSNVANKLDPRVDSDRDGSNRGMGAGMGGMGMGTTHHGSTNVGPHDSNVANKLDPRVDSDRDGRSGMKPMSGTNKHDSTHHTYTGGPGTQATTNPPHTNLLGTETTAKGLGPHNSGAANVLDPRSHGSNTHHQGQVDSMVDGKTVYGNVAGPHTMSGMKGMGGTTVNPNYGGSGIPDTTHGHGSTTAGPHSSNVGNKLDPRVDSDRDGRGATHNTSTNAGPHNSNAANKLDPRIDSDRDGRANPSSTMSGGKTTHGPHKSDLLNKLDPRVDSDRDGSKTIGSAK